MLGPRGTDSAARRIEALRELLTDYGGPANTVTQKRTTNCVSHFFDRCPPVIRGEELIEPFVGSCSPPPFLLSGGNRFTVSFVALVL